MEILYSNLGNLTWQQVVMWAIGGLLIYLAIAKDMEPSLLLPMGFGAILVNLPMSGAIDQWVSGQLERGALSVLYALGANVTVMDINVGILRQLGDKYQGHINTMFCNQQTIASVLPQTDMVINCVKWPKQRKDFLITKEMLKLMEPGSVLVDISNDDPGAIESSHETHHDDPRYVVNGVVHYCVSNIPGAVAHSTSVSLAAETLPMLLNIMNNGLAEACVRDGFIRRSLACYKGYLTHEETSGIQGKPWIRPEDILGIADRQLDPAPPATTTRSTNFIKL